MDPEELARSLVAKYGKDGALRELEGSQDPTDRAVVAAIQRQGGGGLVSRIANRVREVGQQGVAGLGEVLPTAALGFAETQRAVNPAARLIPNRDADLRAGLAQRRQETAPQSGLGAVARIGGRIAGEGALAATGGGAASRALQVGRFAGSALSGAVVGGAVGAAGPEESTLGAVGTLTGSEGIQRASENPLLRSGLEAAASVGGDLALRGIGSAFKRIRANRLQTQVARRADDLTQAAERTDGPLAGVFSDTADEHRRALVDVRAQALAGPESTIDVDAELNIPKWSGGDEQLADRMRDSARRVFAEHGPDLKGYRSKETVEALAREFEVDAEAVLKKAPKDMTDAELLMLRNVGNDMVERVEQASRVLNDAAATADEKLAAEATYRRATDILDRAVYQHMVGGAEAGRTLASMRYIGKKAGTPFVWLTEAARTAGRELTDVERETVLRMAREGETGKLASFIAGLRESTVKEKVISIWKAGLLYLPTTHMANLTGNTSMLALSTAADVPAFIVDRALSALTRNRTKALSVGQVAAAFRGLREGARRGARVLRGEAAPSLDKVDIPRQVNFDNAFWRAYTNTPFRGLSAGDQVFHEASFMRALYEQADLLTRRAGLRGNDQTRRIFEILKNPPDEMVLEGIARVEIRKARGAAEATALFDTFRNRGPAARGANKIREGINTLTGGVGGELVVPFTTTPANVGARVLEASPIGFIAGVGELTGRGLMKLVKGSAGLTPEVQKRIAETIGRSTVGSAPIVAGMVLASQGRITGNLPKTGSERDQFYLEQRIPNAVYINGKWRSFERLSPVGNLVLLGGEMYRNFTDQELSMGGAAVASGFGAARTLTEQPFLTGTSALAEAVNDPMARGPRFVENLAGSLTGPLGGIARAVDPTIRETDGVAETVQSRIPFVSRGLPAKVNQFGEDVQRQPRGARSLVDPLRSTKDRRDDPVTSELSRLGINLTNRNRKRSLESGREFEGRAREEGLELREKIEEVMLWPSYPGMTDDFKRLNLQREIDRLRETYQNERLRSAHGIESLAGVE